MNAPIPGYYAVRLGGPYGVPPFNDFLSAVEEIASGKDADGNARATIDQILKENPEGLLKGLQWREKDVVDLALLKQILKG